MSGERFEVHDTEPESKICVVYDARSGAIIHLHQIIALPGADSATDEELKAEALEFAAQGTDRSRANVETLVVARGSVDREAAYKVDVEHACLVEIGQFEAEEKGA